MKLKHQITILCFSILILPITSIIISPFIREFNNRNNKRVDIFEIINNLEIPETTASRLYETLNNMTTQIDFVLFKDETVIYSSSDDFYKKDQVIKIPEISELISNTADTYIYQIERIKDPEQNNSVYKIISRVSKSCLYKNSSFTKKLYIALTFFIILGTIFEIFFITRTISKSTKKLVSQSEIIASGNLNQIIDKKSFPDNEFRTISENLEILRKTLHESQDRKNRFIMGVSHDLRTPLAIITGYAEALRDGIYTKKEDCDKALFIINEKAAQLQLMINSLLDYAKLDSEELGSKINEENFNDFISDFLNNYKTDSQIFKRIISININLPETRIIPMNKILVQRALENLLKNSYKYTKDNGTIKISCYEKENNIYITIEDDGIGIKENDIPHIFDLFFKVSNSRSDNSTSIGIGLAVVKNVIDIHKWDIDVKSIFGKGTTITIIIPVPQN